MPSWTVVTDTEHHYSVRIPNATPGGQPVEILRDERDGLRRLHAHSPDESELYFEIASYPGLVDHREAAAWQKSFLSERSSDGTLTNTSATTLKGLPATELVLEGTLGGRWKVRRFLFVDAAHRTYRIVYDPTSELNRQILDTLVIGVQDDT